MSELQIMPRLDPATEAALRVSIERFGVLVPVVKDQDGRILDGHHRARLADEMGVEYEIQIQRVADDDEAREVARTLNVDRRHLTLEQRRPVVAALREDGHSTRAIAGALGITRGSVQHDLKTQGGLIRPPAVVVGKDGKHYPAQRAQEPTAPKSIDPRRPPAAARTLNKTMAQLAGHSSGLAAFRIDLAFVGATPDDLALWERTAGEAISVLTKFRRALREARSAAA